MDGSKLWDKAIKTADPFLREGLEQARKAGYGLWYDERTHEFTCAPQRGECSHDGCNLCDFYENCRFGGHKEEEYEKCKEEFNKGRENDDC